MSVEGKEILKGLSLEVSKGEVHALMGPNGSGKSTFANTLMGHPKYEVTSGDILFKGESVLEKKTDERARLGLFMAFQYPVAIPGLTFGSFLRAALNARLAPADPNANGKMPTKHHTRPTAPTPASTARPTWRGNVRSSTRTSAWAGTKATLAFARGWLGGGM